MQSKYKYLAKNTLIFAISSFGTKFLSFLLVPLYTNILTTSEYGKADLMTTTGYLLMYVFTINIADAVMRFVIERKEIKHEILRFGIKVLIIGSLIVVFLICLLSYYSIFDWENKYYLYTFLYFFFTAFFQLLSCYLRAIERVKDVAIVGIVSALVFILGNIFFLVVVKIGIDGYLISLILSPLISSVYCIFRIGLKPREFFGCICDIAIQKEMITYSVPLIFNSLTLWVNAFLDKYFILVLYGTDANGVYSIANKIPTILTTCYMVFSQAWSLSAIKEFDREDKDGFFVEIYELYNAAITTACCIIILMNIPLAKILYAKEFFVAWNYSSILLLAVMFNAMTSFLGNIFAAVKKTKSVAITTIVSASVNIVLNMCLIPSYGVLGASIATMVAYFVMWVMRLSLLRKYINLRINLFCHCLIYALLLFQVIIEHFIGHKYLGQFIILVFIIFLNRNYILKIFVPIINNVKKMAGGRNESIS